MSWKISIKHKNTYTVLPKTYPYFAEAHADLINSIPSRFDLHHISEIILIRQKSNPENESHNKGGGSRPKGK